MGKSQKRVKLIFLKVTFTKFDAVTLSGHPKNQLEKTPAQNSTEKEVQPRSLTANALEKWWERKTFALPIGIRQLFRGELLNFGGIFF